MSEEKKLKWKTGLVAVATTLVELMLLVGWFQYDLAPCKNLFIFVAHFLCFISILGAVAYLDVAAYLTKGTIADTTTEEKLHKEIKGMHKKVLGNQGQWSWRWLYLPLEWAIVVYLAAMGSYYLAVVWMIMMFFISVIRNIWVSAANWYEKRMPDTVKEEE